MAILDLLLTLGLTLRLTRLVVIDDLSARYLHEPVGRWATTERRQFWVGGLSCPWCIGFWIGAGVLFSLWTSGGPGNASDIWRYIAGAFTLNWVVGHVGPRLGDAGYSK